MYRGRALYDYYRVYYQSGYGKNFLGGFDWGRKSDRSSSILHVKAVTMHKGTLSLQRLNAKENLNTNIITFA